MDRNQERYFFLSGLISISFFLLIVFFTGYSLIIAPKIEQFAMVKSDVINVSIAFSENTPAVESEPESLPLNEEIEMVDVPTPIPQREPVPEISDLFSQVTPDKNPKKIQDDTKHKEQLSALEKEIMQRKETTRFSEKVNKLSLLKPSVKMVVQGGSTGPIVNEYHAKIQGLVYTYFRPPSGSVGQSARVRMTISAEGKLMAYKIISYGGSGSFNNEVEWLKDRLNGIRFPEHPEGKDAVLEFILTAKEQ